MELWKFYHKKSHEIEVRNGQLLGFELELFILHEMVSDQDISLNMSGFITWFLQIFCFVMLYPRHKLDRLMGGNFQRNICHCACKLLHESNHTIVHLEFVQLFFKGIHVIGSSNFSYYLWPIYLFM